MLLARSKPSAILSAVVLISFILLLGCSSPKSRSRRLISQAQREEQAGEWQQAASDFERATRLDPQNAAAYAELAHCDQVLGSTSDALSAWQTAFHLESTNVSYAVSAARAALAVGDLAGAHDYATALLNSAPQQAHLLLARLFAIAQQDTLARNELAIVLSANASSSEASEAYVLFGYLGLEHSDAPAAERDFQKALQLGADNAEAYSGLGHAAAMQKHWTEAEANFRAAARLHSDDTRAWEALVTWLLAKPDTGAAERAAKDAAATMPNIPAAYRLFGNTLIAEGKLQPAAEAYAAIHKAHPQDVRAALNYSQLLLLQGDREKASELNTELLQRHSSDSEVLLQQAELLLQRDQVPVARSALQDLRNREPNDPWVHFYNAYVMRLDMDFGGSDREFEQAQTLHKSQAQLDPAATDLALSQFDIGRLNFSSSGILRRQPLPPAGYVKMAASEMARSFYHLAEKDLAQAFAVAPDSAAAFAQLGKLRAIQGRAADAESAYRRALQSAPADYDANKSLMELLLAHHEKGRAHDLLDQALARAPRSGALLALKGELCLRDNDYSGAENAARSALAANPREDRAYSLLVRVQLAKGDHAAARNTADDWLKSYPGVDALIGAGEAYEAAGDWETAQAKFKEALTMSPENAEAAAGFADSLLQHDGDASVAITNAALALRHDPASARYADLMGWAYFQTGSYVFAEKMLQQAVNTAPEDAAYHYHLGRLYAKELRPDAAERELRRAVQLDPSIASRTDVQPYLTKR